MNGTPQSGLGTPHMPQWLVKVLIGFGGLAGVTSQIAPPYTIAGKIAAGILAFLPALAMMSPGTRDQSSQ